MTSARPSSSRCTNAVQLVLFLALVVALPLALCLGLVCFVTLSTITTPEKMAVLQYQHPQTAWRGPLEVVSAFKLARLQAERPDVVILGASRAGQFRCAMFKPYSCYNAGFIGWSLTRTAEVLKIMGGSKPPKLVVLTSDFANLGPDYERYYSRELREMPLAYPWWTLAGSVIQGFIKSAALHVMAPFSPMEDFIRKTVGRLVDNEVQGPPAFISEMAFRNDGSWFDMPREGPAARRRRALHQMNEVPSQMQHLDRGQLDLMASIGETARRRGIAVTAIQVPFPSLVTSFLDASKDFTIHGMRYPSSLWREFEKPQTAATFAGWGISFFNSGRISRNDGAACFFDSMHPGEYPTLVATITALKDPRVRAVLPAIDIGALEQQRDRAKATGNCFDVFP
jgi:hypothetical protein